MPKTAVKKRPKLRVTDKLVERIVAETAANFRGFGGGKKSSWGNPISAALKGEPPMFAAGVDVEEVVRFVLGRINA